MKEYYKVNVCSEYTDLSKKETKIIVEKGIWFAKEIMTKNKLMICDNKLQGGCYDFYVSSKELTDENLARYDEVKKYIENFDINKLPVYTRIESKQIQKLIKKKHI